MSARNDKLVTGIRNALTSLLDNDAMGTREERDAISWLYPLLIEDERKTVFKDMAAGWPPARNEIAERMNGLEQDLFGEKALVFF